MIVRLSGSQSLPIASQLNIETSQPISVPRLRFRGLSIRAWLYLFHAPRSYTAEDTAEFHIPGNPLLARMLLDELIARGARLAEAGEFTARAYFNGRLDLSQAEGVAATIAAGNEDELHAARQLLAGELARRVKPAIDLLADTLALVEVGIDFSEEDISFLSTEEIQGRLRNLDRMLDSLLHDSARFERLHHVPRFVLVGRPNAGKSTLLNALAGHQRAVVSSVPGTTRDALSAEIVLARGIAQLFDVAGIESAEGDNQIDRQMQTRSFEMIESADHVILLHDCADTQPALILPRQPSLTVLSKSDLHKSSFDAEIKIRPHSTPRKSDNLDELAFGKSSSATLAMNARHIQAIQAARDALSRTLNQALAGGPELLAVELREALDSLGEITGQVTPDDVLGRIFAGFCIGK
jgi:tRNA modification GTPase